DYIALWAAHVRRYHIRHGQPVFFARAWQLLKGEKDTMGWVPDFFRPASTKQIRGVTGRVQRGIDAALDRGDVAFADAPTWKLEPKVLRKTFACNQYLLYVKSHGAAGMDLIRLQNALGHASPAQTRVYLADVDQYLDATIPR